MSTLSHMAGRPAFRAWSSADDASSQTFAATVIDLDLRGTMAKTRVHKAGVFFDCAECGKLLRDCAEHNSPIPPDCPPRWTPENRPLIDS
jgi:hypothetical protein